MIAEDSDDNAFYEIACAFKDRVGREAFLKRVF